MQISARPCATAGAVLAAASLVAITPVTPVPLILPTRNVEIRLIDESLLNVPVNLLYDIANIPFNEVAALNSVAGSLFFDGSWWVPSATNLWGIDPGDPGHVALVTNLLVPFPDLNEGLGGLQYQVDGLLAAELPVSASCDAETCAPITPPDVVTGSTAIDRTIGFYEAISSQREFGLFDNWFKVPIPELIDGYAFDDATNPSGPAFANPAFVLVNGGENPFEGGTVGPDDAMPWAGHTFHLNLLQPFQNYFDSLLQTPPAGGDIPATGIEVPTLNDFTQSLQSVAAALVVAFNPYTPGSPACPAACDLPESMTTHALVDMLDPNDSNPMIQAWLAGVDGTGAFADNNATPEQVAASIAMLQTGMFNLTPEQLAEVIGQLEEIDPGLPGLAVHAGILTDPGYLTFLADPSSEFDPVYGGWNPTLVLPDIAQLLIGDANVSDVSGFFDSARASFDVFNPVDLWANLQVMIEDLNPGASAMDWAVSSSQSELTSLVTDLSALMASLTPEFVPELVSSAVSAV